MTLAGRPASDLTRPVFIDSQNKIAIANLKTGQEKLEGMANNNPLPPQNHKLHVLHCT